MFKATKGGKARKSVFKQVFGGGDLLGDVMLFANGTACVNNQWNGLVQWFDNPKTGHDDAVRYIESRMCAAPEYVTLTD